VKHPRFVPFDGVRVIRLLDPDRPYDGADGIARPPRIGDEAVVVHFNPFGPGELDPRTPLYILECVAAGGRPYWIADFAEEELELVWTDPCAPRSGSSPPPDAG
jgi:hypothetical protein